MTLRVGVLALSAWLVPPVLAGSQATVRQLADMLAAAHAANSSDAKIAEEIGGVELTERLTSAALSTLSGGEGKRTAFALWVLSGESAFLEPPVAELPAGAPPSPAEQRAIAARASDFALAYIRNLPDFRCTQTIRRLDDDYSADYGSPVGVVGPLHLKDVIVSDLAFIRGVEKNDVRTVNGAAWSKKRAMWGLTTSGEFGSILAAPFFGSAAKAKWSHWETIGGKRVAVFDYSIDRVHSKYTLTWCCDEWGRQQEKVAYRGALFIEPASGAILRVTRRAEGISAKFPMRRSDTAVEYRTVDIGGQSWLCPVRSIALSESFRKRSVGGVQESQNALGHIGETGRADAGGAKPVHDLNDVAFSDYHKFDAASTVMKFDMPPEDDKTGVPAVPDMPPAELAPAAVPTPPSKQETPPSFPVRIE